MFDLVIISDTIATDYSVFSGAIVVSNGKIVQILEENESIPDAKKIIDAKGKIVMPGCIDSHVHIWEPGQIHRDDFDYGTRSAAIGGITTILEHPLSIPPVKNKDAFKLKLDLANKKSHIDFGLWGALVPDNLEKIKGLKELGCVAFKGFISYANEDYPNIPDNVLYEAMTLFKELDVMLALHSENANMVDAGEKSMKKNERIDPLAHLESRESIVELEAINRVIFFAEKTGAHVHIVHMSIHEGAELIKEAKKRGVNITVETCPHYLVTNSNLLKEKGPFAKCTPPFRRPENTKKMWQYIEDGTIDFIASDHSSYTIEEKEAGLKNIWLAPNGLPGIATMVPKMIEAALVKRNISLQRFVQMMSTNISKIFNIYPKKGTILPGSDADFTIIDKNKKWTINGEDLYKCGWSPYDGHEVQGYIDKTIVRGKIIYENGKVNHAKGFGEFIKPNLKY